MKKGFTLAEVLITLGIIGVVAALTIPTLINEYQKTAYVTQLRKMYSMTQNVVNKIMYDNYSFGNGGFLNAAKLSCSDCYTKSDSVEVFKQYLKIADVCSQYVDIDGIRRCVNGEGISNITPDGINMILADGSVIVFSSRTTLGGANWIKMDVNGVKGPNEAGRDRFVFCLGTNGALIPNGSAGCGFTRWNSESYGCLLDNPDGTIYNGDSCTARIIENGWKMDY